MIHLKTIKGSIFDDMRFAVLVEPDVPMRNDHDLYRAVREAGNAVIVPYVTPVELGAPVEVPAAEFCETWRGD